MGRHTHAWMAAAQSGAGARRGKTHRAGAPPSLVSTGPFAAGAPSTCGFCERPVCVSMRAAPPSGGPRSWVWQHVAPGVLGREAEEIAGFVDGVEGLVVPHLPTHLHPVVEAGLNLRRRHSNGHVGVGDVEDL